MRWSVRDLAEASLELRARVSWLLDAERLAEVASRLEGVLAQKADPQATGYHDLMFARARAADSLREIDAAMLMDDDDG